MALSIAACSGTHHDRAVGQTSYIWREAVNRGITGTEAAWEEQGGISKELPIDQRGCLWIRSASLAPDEGVALFTILTATCHRNEEIVRKVIVVGVCSTCVVFHGQPRLGA